VYRKRHEDLVQIFKMESGLVACTDIDGPMQTLAINHNPMDRRLLQTRVTCVSKQFSFTIANNLTNISTYFAKYHVVA